MSDPLLLVFETHSVDGICDVLDRLDIGAPVRLVVWLTTNNTTAKVADLR